MTKVVIDYTNYRGERGVRVITPLFGHAYFGTTVYHPQPQWLLPAFDHGKGENRVFAMQDIHSWRPALPLPQDPQVSLNFGSADGEVPHHPV